MRIIEFFSLQFKKPKYGPYDSNLEFPNYYDIKSTYTHRPFLFSTIPSVDGKPTPINKDGYNITLVIIDTQIMTYSITCANSVPTASYKWRFTTNTINKIRCTQKGTANVSIPTAYQNIHGYPNGTSGFVHSIFHKTYSKSLIRELNLLWSCFALKLPDREFFYCWVHNSNADHVTGHTRLDHNHNHRPLIPSIDL